MIEARGNVKNIYGDISLYIEIQNAKIMNYYREERKWMRRE